MTKTNYEYEIICERYDAISKLITKKIIDLSIIYPPYTHTTKNCLAFFKLLLDEIVKVTKPGGICCFFIEDVIDPVSDIMSMNTTKSFLEIMSTNNDWFIDDQIIWVKNDRKKDLEINSMNSGKLINFENTPFSTIYILVKKGSEFEPIDFREKIATFLISQDEKDAMMDGIWHIHPISNKKYHDKIPPELASKLILLFSQKNNLILDPFCGTGIIAEISKKTGRNIICLDENPTNCKITKKRISD